ncbi:MAG: pyridoxine 5'-phosphate synthase [Leptospirales bacterium]|jgi:pyridoxine 5-phosphate synthase
MNTTALSVNINKVALLRNARHLTIPDVRRAARVCLAAGAQGVTVHPRPDERHIRGADVDDLAEVLREFAPDARTAGDAGESTPPKSAIEFNIEGNPFDANGRFLQLVRETKPAQCTLVPDSPDQPTSDHGFDVLADAARLGPVIQELRALDIRVSVFMDAENLDGIRALSELGAHRIELYTEPYAAAFERHRAEVRSPAAAGPTSADHLERTVEAFAEAARVAHAAGLGVNAGHDLSLENLPFFLGRVAHVLEVSIGHALIAEAIFQGLEQTVRDYLDVIADAHAGP